jgi:hypothetical protein
LRKLVLNNAIFELCEVFRNAAHAKREKERKKEYDLTATSVSQG